MKLDKIKIVAITTLILFVFNNSIIAQNIEKNKDGGVKLIARPYKDSILLRWAPDNSLLWEDANKTGYVLERVTLVRDGKLISNPEHKVLSNIPFLPQPLANWETAVKSNKYAGVAAQALYGETFEVQEGPSANLNTIITKVRERDTRFSFALFAADQSPLVAKLSGLWYTDTDVKENEKYFYKVYLAYTTVKADTGIVYTSPSEYQPLPKPIGLQAEFGDKKVELSWNQLFLRHVYNSYILERSDDGGNTFNPVTNEPIVNLQPNSKVEPELMYKSDSIPQNSKTYYYRVRGISSFGETSLPSDTVSGKGVPDITATPFITEHVTKDNQSITLTWEFPEEKNHEIEGFKIARSDNSKKGFTYIAENINAKNREYTDTEALLTNYYIISAYNKGGNEVRSMPVIVQLVDSVPPHTPVNLQGHIDTTGKVTICWPPNTDEDIYGYRVYRSNFKDHEFSQLTSSPVKDTCFTDSVTLKTLTPNVYYSIMAIDQKQNHSALSEALKLKRPDKIPPVSAVFSNIQSTTEGVSLEWINSSSIDVKEHLLYRSIPGTENWELIAAFNLNDSVDSYYDIEAPLESYCLYTLIAFDDSGNESEPSDPVSGKKINAGIKKGIEEIFVDKDPENGIIKLAWESLGSSVYRYMVFRSENDQQMALYKSLPGTEDTFKDTDVKIYTRYTYSIKVVYADGSQSTFCKPTLIDY